MKIYEKSDDTERIYVDISKYRLGKKTRFKHFTIWGATADQVVELFKKAMDEQK